MRKGNDISTPEGYFPALEGRLRSIADKREPKPMLMQRLSPALAYAAALAALVAVGNAVLGRAAAPKDDEWDYVAYLSQSLDPDGQIELMEAPELDEEDILSYLIADNISVEQLAFASDEENY